MQWECHECGAPHDSIPEACTRCGTRPEIVANVWRCPHCGQEGIPATAGRCPGCGADRGLGAQTAVDPTARLEGERARQLAEGEWRYCAYCDVQVPPVDEQGRANESCPTCHGPLSEATRRAAEETVAAAEAGRYRDEAVEPVGAAPRPAPAPRRGRRWIFALLGAAALVVLGVVLYLALRGPEAFVVAGRSWTRSIAVERFGPTAEEGWAEALPAGARDRQCAPAVHHYDRVPDGVERYQEREPSGRRCVAHAYKKKGGASVKQCSSWETTYRTVTRTRTRYRRVPVMRSKCRYTVDRWHAARALTASGTDAEAPRWPDASGLGRGERAGARTERYLLTLRDVDGATKEYPCKSGDEFARYPLRARVMAEVSLGGKVTALRSVR